MAAAIRARRMVRAFRPDRLRSATVDELIDLARRAPSAGNTQPLDFLVLEGDDCARYWDVTLPEPARRSFRWQALLDAPLLVVPYVRPAAYVERYAEDDKVATGLGDGTEAWPVPYWWVDGGAAVQNLLLAAVALGLGACLFGQFEHEPAVRAAFGVPDDRRALGTVAVGHPLADEPGRSADRARRPFEDQVHRNHW